MPGPVRAISHAEARAVLGLGPAPGPHDVRSAFRDAAKRVHPDRPGGDAEQFRHVLDAYHRLQAPELAIAGPPMVAEAALQITPADALLGGDRQVRLADGRLIRVRLPAGLRDGERLRAGQALFRVAIAAEGDTMVRGDDLWMSAAVAPHVLAEGGRIAVETPLGRRIVWITRKAAQHGLIRLEGQGLPARAGHPNGALFLRLAAGHLADSQARQHLRRFAAAWAA
jgi:curved DNA-binding protein